MRLPAVVTSLLLLCSVPPAHGDGPVVARFPKDGATEVNPDTHLVLSFTSRPTLGSSGKIRISDASDDRLVDCLDLSIPPGPTTPDQAQAPYTPAPYQYLPGRWT